MKILTMGEGGAKVDNPGVDRSTAVDAAKDKLASGRRSTAQGGRWVRKTVGSSRTGASGAAGTPTTPEGGTPDAAVEASPAGAPPAPDAPEVSQAEQKRAEEKQILIAELRDRYKEPEDGTKKFDEVVKDLDLAVDTDKPDEAEANLKKILEAQQTFKMGLGEMKTYFDGDPRWDAVSGALTDQALERLISVYGGGELDDDAQAQLKATRDGLHALLTGDQAGGTDVAVMAFQALGGNMDDRTKQVLASLGCNEDDFGRIQKIVDAKGEVQDITAAPGDGAEGEESDGTGKESEEEAAIREEMADVAKEAAKPGLTKEQRAALMERAKKVTGLAKKLWGQKWFRVSTYTVGGVYGTAILLPLILFIVLGLAAASSGQ